MSARGAESWLLLLRASVPAAKRGEQGHLVARVADPRCAVASLHLDLHYPRYDIALDVDALDILVYSPSNQPLVAVEAKQSSKLLEGMLAEISTLQRHGLEVRCNAPPLSNAAKKYRGLLALRPEFFLAVAPGISRAYAVHYPDDRAVQTAELISIEGIPAATDQG